MSLAPWCCAGRIVWGGFLEGPVDKNHAMEAGRWFQVEVHEANLPTLSVVCDVHGTDLEPIVFVGVVGEAKLQALEPGRAI
jgi:hypothetical protein